jgi:hypothetical protein
MDQEFVTLPRARTGDRSRLDAALSADSARERTRALRQTLVHLLAILGVPLWLAAVWPRGIGSRLAAIVVTCWGLCLAAALAATLWEWRCQRARTQRIAALGPLPRLRTAGPCTDGPEEES